MNKIKLILDTDIGDDIDDSFALLLALNNENIELLGVTTVFRNSLKRAKMAAHLINKMQRKVDVYAGINHPLLNEVEIEPRIKAKEKLDENGLYLIPQWLEIMKDSPVQDKNAIDFIIEQVHKHPNEVVIAPIGPLTNIAMAIRKDPSIIPLIKEIRLMGGGLDINFAEWNLFCDPEAAYIVFNSGIKIFAVGINVTMKTELSDEDVNELKESKSSSIQIIYEMMMKWFEHYNFSHPVMHDPLVIASLIDSSVVEFTPMHAQIDLINLRGKMLVGKENYPLINVATEIDKEKFRRIFKSNVEGRGDNYH